MSYGPEQFTYLLEVLLLCLVILMHLSKKSLSVISIYAGQSAAIVGLLFLSAVRDGSLPLVLVACVMLAVKVFFAPYFLGRLVRRHGLKFTSSTYLNPPLTLIVLALLMAMPFSSFMKPLAALAPAGADLVQLAVAMIMISVFLIINRKGALSQIIGILSLENSIVLFAAVAGLEQSLGLELGIIFDILVWIIIATVFVSMVYRQFGTLDVTEMSTLKED